MSETPETPQDPATPYPAPPAYPQQPPPPQQPPAYPPQQYPAQQYPAAPQYQAPAQYPYPQQPGGWEQHPAYAADPDKRPGTVTAAAVITWISCSLTVVGSLFLMIAAAALSEADLEEAFDGTGWNADDIRTGFIWVGGVLVVWALAALVLAVFAFRRSNGGRIALVVSSAFTIPAGLIGFGAIVPVLFAFAAIAVIVLLFTGGANAWYRREGSAQAPPGQYPPGTYSPGPY